MSVQPFTDEQWGACLDRDLELTEALDWDYEPKCEHPKHATVKMFHDDGPAWALARATMTCPTCGPQYGRIRYVCKAWTLSKFFNCPGCRAQGPGKVHILALVNP